jgi:hypothetical protein
MPGALSALHAGEAHTKSNQFLPFTTDSHAVTPSGVLEVSVSFVLRDKCDTFLRAICDI